MTGDLDLFDRPMVEDEDEARVVTAEAVARAADGARRTWLHRAREATMIVARRSGPQGFTSDDIWRRMGTDVPREGRAMGAVIRGLAAGRHIIHRQCATCGHGQYRISEDPKKHQGPQRVWHLAESAGPDRKDPIDGQPGPYS